MSPAGVATVGSGEPWRPSATLAALRLRAEVYAQVRQFFASRGVLEVDTPMLSTAMNPDFNIDSVVVQGEDQPRYLHTSPEFPMKRLLAAGSGPIWQLCRVFRRGEAGRRHNPEFTLLEWYQTGYSEADLMQEVGALLRRLTPDLSEQRLTYREAFAGSAGFDPLAVSLAELAERTHQRFHWRDDERDPMLDLWLAEVVEPALPKNQLTFISHWPASMAALADCVKDADGYWVARRFEAFWQGMELANGYYELRDPVEQQRRFDA
ncbi:MAG: amino acid--tRNA ligase-related protein, partial [Natronospirillum sp.]